MKDAQANVDAAQKVVNEAAANATKASQLLEQANNLLKNIDWNQNANNGSDNNNSGSNSTNDDNIITNNNGSNVNNNSHAVNNGLVSEKVAVKSNNNNDTKAATLPQTGNENASAIVALGAVSAMFGLGLAAKKREF